MKTARRLFQLLIALNFLSPVGALAQVNNPILPGFYPDPSICRVAGDYYLVNSSFSFFPGVPIFHSTDLIHWKQIGHVLDRPSQLNLTNQRISGGIYAPAIRYHQGTFYMVTTFVDGGGNFYVTAKDPAGPWSDPLWLPEIDGIDPSFFFDENGKTYIVNNGPPPDNQPLYNGHRAIWLQEFDLKAQKLTGERKIVINGGTDLSRKPIWIEGPHLFQKNGFYYLMAAEGGTAEDHSEVIFKSKSIWGPYESFEANPILTQRDLPADRSNPVTCTGHADLVQTRQGDWVAVFLGCQPYSGNYFNTGRQTFFQTVDWNGEWPIILEKGIAVPNQVKSPIPSNSDAPTFAAYSADWRDDFDQPELKLEWNFIRTPNEQWYQLKNGSLLIEAGNVGIDHRGNPSFIGRRQQHAFAEMTISISLEKGKEMEAGLVAFQNEKNYYSVVLKHSQGKYILYLSSAAEELESIQLDELMKGNLCLRIQALGDTYKCEYSSDNKAWKQLGKNLDGKYLSTRVAGGFVGVYLGLYARASTPATATFEWATYKALEELRHNHHYFLP